MKLFDINKFNSNFKVLKSISLTGSQLNLLSNYKKFPLLDTLSIRMISHFDNHFNLNSLNLIGLQIKTLQILQFNSISFNCIAFKTFKNLNFLSVNNSQTLIHYLTTHINKPLIKLQIVIDSKLDHQWFIKLKSFNRTFMNSKISSSTTPPPPPPSNSPSPTLTPPTSTSPASLGIGISQLDSIDVWGICEHQYLALEKKFQSLNPEVVEDLSRNMKLNFYGDENGNGFSLGNWKFDLSMIKRF